MVQKKRNPKKKDLNSIDLKGIFKLARKYGASRLRIDGVLEVEFADVSRASADVPARPRALEDPALALARQVADIEKAQIQGAAALGALGISGVAGLTSGFATSTHHSSPDHSGSEDLRRSVDELSRNSAVPSDEDFLYWSTRSPLPSEIKSHQESQNKNPDAAAPSAMNKNPELSGKKKKNMPLEKTG